jgi:hypothetical protein
MEGAAPSNGAPSPTRSAPICFRFNLRLPRVKREAGLILRHPGTGANQITFLAYHHHAIAVVTRLGLNY